VWLTFADGVARLPSRTSWRDLIDGMSRRAVRLCL
jgi:hypothetical protein